jgi:hypothetical protein
VTAVIGDPQTWFITNPHPCLAEGERVRIRPGFPDETLGTVQCYVHTSPINGDLYHVLPDGYHSPLTFRLAQLKPLHPKTYPLREDAEIEGEPT